MTKKVVKLTADPEKAATVECERQRLMELFAGADQNRLDFIRDAVQQVAWLGITILELQAEIDQRGTVVTFQNGREQTGLQANPACKVLKDYQQLYNTQFRALLPVLPEKMEKGRLDELKEFRVEPMTEEEKEEAYKIQMEQLAKIRKGIPINNDSEQH